MVSKIDELIKYLTRVFNGTELTRTLNSTPHLFKINLWGYPSEMGI